MCVANKATYFPLPPDEELAQVARVDELAQGLAGAPDDEGRAVL